MVDEALQDRPAPEGAPRTAESPTLTLAVQNDVELAPGLELHAELSFFTTDDKDVYDQLVCEAAKTDGEASARDQLGWHRKTATR